MTTHEGHDHPNTKAARAACRRGKSANTLPPMSDEEKARVKANKPKARKAKPAARKITGATNTSLPHEFDEDMDRPGFCYVCRLNKQARVHEDGPTDLAARFSF